MAGQGQQNQGLPLGAAAAMGASLGAQPTSPTSMPSFASLMQESPSAPQPASQQQEAYTPAQNTDPNSLKTLSLISALAGLGLNTAGLITQTGAHGNELLAAAGDYAKKADQAQSNKDLLGSLSGEAPKIRDPQDQQVFASYLNSGDASKAQQFLNHTLSVQNAYDNHLDAMNKYGRALQKSDDRWTSQDVASLERNLSTAIKSYKGTLNPAAEQALKIESALSSLKDPGSFDLGNFKLQNPGLKLDKESGAALKAAVQSRISKNRQWGNGPLGLPGLAPGTTSSQVFGGISQDLVSPDALQKHSAQLQQLNQMNEQLQAAKWLRSNIGNRDPQTRAKFSAVLNALRANANIQ